MSLKLQLAIKAAVELPINEHEFEDVELKEETDVSRLKRDPSQRYVALVNLIIDEIVRSKALFSASSWLERHPSWSRKLVIRKLNFAIGGVCLGCDLGEWRPMVAPALLSPSWNMQYQNQKSNRRKLRYIRRTNLRLSWSNGKPDRPSYRWKCTCLARVLELGYARRTSCLSWSCLPL